MQSKCLLSCSTYYFIRLKLTFWNLKTFKDPANLNVNGKKYHKLFLFLKNIFFLSQKHRFLQPLISPIRLIHLLLTAVDSQARMLLDLPDITFAQCRNMIPTLLRRNWHTSDLPKVTWGEWNRARNSVHTLSILIQS